MKRTDLKKILPGADPVVLRGSRYIPVCQPCLGGNELRYVCECVRSNWISSAGSFIRRFEDSFRRHCGVKYAAACSSGTAALHLALAALGIKRGDEVIIPTFTMIATANAVAYLGARPVLVDAEAQTWNIDPDKIKDKITRRTKAIVVVHTYGLPADMERINALAGKHKLFVVEDAAEAHGAQYHGRKVGGLGDAGCFSFYGNKIITTGEGGMVTANNKEFIQRVRLLRDHAFSAQRHFWHKFLGYNYRMTNLQAAVGLAQTERFDLLVGMRLKNARHYRSLLGGILGISLPARIKDIKNVYWMYGILVEDAFGMSRDELRAYLARRGIETRTFFVPIHLQPLYVRKYRARFGVAEELCRKGMYLPSGGSLAKSDIEYVAAAIKAAAKDAR